MTETNTQTMNVVKTQKEHIIIYADGTKRVARLFIYYDGRICEYKKGSSRYGHLLDMSNVVSIEPQQKNVISLAEKARKFLNKVCKCLEKSGLWGNILHDFRILLSLSDEQLEKYLNSEWDECVKKSNELGLLCGRMCGVDDLKYTIEKGVKSINYNSWDKESKVAEFGKAIAEKREFSAWWRKGYDNSISCKESTEKDVMCAWYSEEYKGCGNGHYYLAIDEKHAIFCEDD